MSESKRTAGRAAAQGAASTSGRTAAQAAQTAAVERWALPEVNGPIIGRLRNEPAAAGSGASRQESEARGYQAGIERAQAQMHALVQDLSARVAQLDAVLQLLGKPLQQLDAEIEQELLQLALAVGKQLARRELRTDPGQVIAILRESLAQLPANAREIRILLHPEDAATIRERLTPPASERAWSIIEDPTQARGGCIVRTDTSQIDARLESRISSVIANALGEERAAERQTPTASGSDP